MSSNLDLTWESHNEAHMSKMFGEIPEFESVGSFGPPMIAALEWLDRERGQAQEGDYFLLDNSIASAILFRAHIEDDMVRTAWKAASCEEISGAALKQAEAELVELTTRPFRITMLDNDDVQPSSLRGRSFLVAIKTQEDNRAEPLQGCWAITLHADGTLVSPPRTLPPSRVVTSPHASQVCGDFTCGPIRCYRRDSL